MKEIRRSGMFSYRRFRRDLVNNLSRSSLKIEDPRLSVSEHWRPFPGYPIPRYLCEGQVFAYMVATMPRVAYVGGKKVVTRKAYETVV